MDKEKERKSFEKWIANSCTYSTQSQKMIAVIISGHQRRCIGKDAIRYRKIKKLGAHELSEIAMLASTDVKFDEMVDSL